MKIVRKPRSDKNLIGIYEISPNPIKILPDLREISPESMFFRRDLEFFRWDLGLFFVGIWIFFFRNMGFLSEYGFFADWFTFLGFKGREIEIDPP